MEYRHIRKTRVVVVGAIALVVAVTSWSYVRRIYRSRALKKTIPNILPQEAENAAVGFTYSKTLSGQTLYSIKAWRNLGLKGNKNILEDVEVMVYGRRGERYDRIHSARADYDQEAGTVSFEGDVDLLLSSKRQEEQTARRVGQDPSPSLLNKVQVKTSKLIYSQRENKAETSAPVQILFNEITGHAVGLHYDATLGHITLQKEVRVRIERGANAPAVEIDSGAMKFVKEQQQILLTSPVEIRQGDSRLEAQTVELLLDRNSRLDQAVAQGNPILTSRSPGSEFRLTAHLLTAKLRPDGKMLDSITAQQNVQAESKGDTSSSQLRAGKLTTFFAGRENKLRQMIAEEEVVLKFLPTPTAPGAALNSAVQNQGSISIFHPGETKILRAPRVEVTWREGGREFERLETPRPGSLELIPRSPTEDRKIVTGDRFFATFVGDRNALNTFRASGHVTVDLEPEVPQPSSTHRATRSDQLMAQFDPATTALTTIEQSGNFHFAESELNRAGNRKSQEPIRQATAARARYFAADKVTVLEGQPKVWDATAKTTAQTLKLEETSNTVTAVGNVLTVYQDKKSNAPTPFGNSQAPLFASADKLVGHTQAKTAVYSGNARLWQEDDALKAEEIQLDQNARTLVAVRRVTSSFLTEGSNPAKKDFVSVAADSLRYEEALDRARYESHVVMQGEMGVLRAPLVDIFLAEKPRPHESRIQRAVAQGGVVIVQPQRQATSERAEFFAQENKIRLTGNQPTITDVERGASTGRELTFFTRDDRILIDGDRQSRATTQHKVARQ